MEDSRVDSLECIECNNVIDEKDKVLRCGGFCDKSFHIKCVNVLVKEFNQIKQLKSKVHWFCDVCCLRLEGSSVLPVSFDVNLVKQIENLFPIVQKLLTNNNDLNTRLSKVAELNSRLCSMFDLGLSLDSTSSDSTTNLEKKPSSKSQDSVIVLNDSSIGELDFKGFDTECEASSSFLQKAKVHQEDMSASMIEPRIKPNINRVLNSKKKLVAANNSRHKQYVQQQPVNIRCFADSQGRHVAREVLSLSGHSVSSVIKPGACFDEVTKGSISMCADLGSEDMAVLIAGTNDVAHNETAGLLSSLRRRLVELRHTNTLVFSVPHRHDLPEWSCVNQEIKIANAEIHNICKFHSNVKVIDLSNLGLRFHTKQGLHLNMLGKRFMAESILSFLDAIKISSDKSKQPIPLGFIGQNDFLGQ